MLPSRFWFQVVSIFFTIGIVFIPIGFAALFASERVIFSACFYVMLIMDALYWWLFDVEHKLNLAFFLLFLFFLLFFHMQVVEIKFQYDQDCVPAKYKHDMVAYIQSNDTDKTCTRKMPAVSLLALLFMSSW